MSIDNILKNTTRSGAPTPEQEQDDPNMFLDVLASPFRGVEGAIQGIYDLADYATGDDLLPDYNQRFLGRSQTFAGGLGEGITQFLTGFIPAAGAASRVGMLTKAGKAGKKALNLKGYAAAGAVADFSVFQAQEERLSNLIEAFPSLSNPITEYLSASEDDGEIEGRLKNTLEGLGVGAAVDSLILGVKALKTNRAGAATEETLTGVQDAFYSMQRDDEFLRSELNEESSIFFKDLDTKFGGDNPTNAYDMLAGMADGYEGEMKPLFDALLANAEQSLKEAEFEFPLVAPRDDKAATYDPQKHKITFKKGGYRTFAHEMLHAVTSREIYLQTKKITGKAGGNSRELIAQMMDENNSGAVAGLYRTYDKVVKTLGKESAVYDSAGGEIYGLKNVHEFVTEAFTNPEFRRMLTEIPSDSGPSKTFFDDFMDSIRAMFGLSKEQGTLLDDVMRDTETIIRDQESAFNAKFDYIKGLDELSGVKPQEQRGHRTLDDRGEDFQVKEGEKSPAIEMQQDRLKLERGKTLSKFTFPVKGAYRGRPIEEIPDGYLRKTLSWNSVSDGVKGRIEAELNARQAGYAPRPVDNFDKRDKIKVSPVTIAKNEALVKRYETELKSEDISPSKRKETEAKLRQAKSDLTKNQLELASNEVGSKAKKQAPEAAGRVVNEGMSPYKDADDYLNTVATGGPVTPKEAYARYLKNRNRKGGLSENNTMRLKEYLENQQLTGANKPTNLKNPRIQGKSQRSSDLELSKQRMTLGQRSISPISWLDDDLFDAVRKGKISSTEAAIESLKRNDVIVPDKYTRDGFQLGKNAKMNSEEANSLGMSHGDAVGFAIDDASNIIEEAIKDGNVLGQRGIDDVIDNSLENLANNLEAGGDQAIRSAGKNIRTTTQALGVVQAIARNLEKAPKAPKETIESLTQETEQIVDLLGGNKADYLANLRKMDAAGMSLSEYRNVQTATKKLIDVMSADVVDVANKVVEARSNPKLNKEQLEVELLSTLEQLHEIQRLWSLMGREAGLTLVQRKFLTAPEGKYRVKENIGFDPQRAKPQDYAKYKNESRSGTMSVDKVADVLAGAKDAKDADTRIKKVAGVNKEVNGNKVMDVVMEYWMNSLLSGPTTQIVNLLGNSLTFAMRTVEQAVGGLVTGNPELTKATMRYAFSMDTIADSWKIAKQTMKTTESTLTQGSRVFDDKLQQSKAIAKDGDDAISVGINTLGSVIRVPSRLLMGGDEFFKQMNYRTYVKTNLAYEAMKKGAKSGDEVAEYVQKNFDNFITKGARAYNEQSIYLDAVAAAKAKGLTYGTDQEQFIKEYLEENKFDESRGGLADAALGFAEENTYTNDLANEGFIGTLSNTLNSLKNKGGMWTTLNFVVPFLRTPTNILKFSLDRTPFGVVPDLVIKKKREALTEAMTSEDPFVRAQTAGKLATATTAVAAGLYYVMQNKEFITGGGPPNRDELESLRLSGWRPYSIKVGDTYYSYQRLDPLATVIGLFADIVEGHHYHDIEGLPMQDMMAITVLSLTNNVTNKSYVKGLDTLFDLVRDPVGNFAPFAGNIAGGFAPTLLSQAQNMADERELKETRAIFDYFLQKVPSNNLPTRRNFLGEAMVNKNSPYMTGVINPIYFNPASDDIVDHELSQLQHGFSRPSTKLFNALEMRDVYNEDGRQAYDRYMELSGSTKIGGKTLRQSLRTLVKDKTYQGLPAESDKDIGEISPRVKAVQRIVRAYRRQAKAEMLKEFPDLQQSTQQLQQDKQEYRVVQ